MKPLTPRQRQTLDAIRVYFAEHDYTPSCAELAETLGCCVSTAWRSTNALERKGYIRREPNVPRGIALW